ncbi:hypothetical protein [Metaclostridioides mangenotii]|uniref:hypothetical protein n=1 Tax=Metaclostridioides mangenotii TaxID=1540 RepID=UPI0026E9B9FD|nr:hypothetical protein [Clostridioides mangenotii]
MNYIIMKIKMFISSYFPLYIILLLINSDRFNSLSKLKNIIKFEDIKISLFFIVILLFIVISFLSLIDLRRTTGSENHSFDSFSKTGDTIISYVMTYLVPILSINIFDNKILIANVILYCLIATMYIKLDLIYLNPLWLLFGYGIYLSSDDNIIITNISYGKLKTLKNTNLRCSILVNNIYLIQKKDNQI